MISFWHNILKKNVILLLFISGFFFFDASAMERKEDSAIDRLGNRVLLLATQKKDLEAELNLSNKKISKLKKCLEEAERCRKENSKKISRRSCFAMAAACCGFGVCFAELYAYFYSDDYYYARY